MKAAIRLFEAAQAVRGGDLSGVPSLITAADEHPDSLHLNSLAGVAAGLAGLSHDAVRILARVYTAQRTPDNLILLATAIEGAYEPATAHAILQAGKEAFPDSQVVREALAAVAYRAGAGGGNVEAPAVAKCDWPAEPITIGSRTVPLWRGERVGRLFLAADEGQGDGIMNARWLRQARQRCDHLSLCVPASLVRLLTPLADNVTDSPGAMLTADAWLPLSQLQHLFAEAPRTYLPHVVPFTRPSGPVRIGLCWRGNHLAGNDSARSAPLAMLAPLARLRGVEFVSLQHGPFAGEPRPPGLRITETSFTDFADTAATVAGLDMVISVCTSTAHLAGAMGANLWLALDHSPDARWTLHPYERVRCFTQARRGDWVPVFARMAERIARVFANRGVTLRPEWQPARTVQLFTPAECDAILGRLSGLTIDDGRLASPFGPVIDEARYRAKDCDLSREQFGDVYAAMERAAGGPLERVRLIVYRPGDHFDWHRDAGATEPNRSRVRSVTVQLSEPNAYIGGDLVICRLRNAAAASRERGAVTIFDARARHTVARVLAGERIALVGWVR